LQLPCWLEPGESFESTVSVGGERFERIVVCTPWLAPRHDLAAFLRDCVAERLGPGDLLVVTEKVVVVTTGRGVPADTVRPGRLARFVAAHVRPVGNSRGLSIPEKAQLVIDTAGWWRVAAAVAAGALTRPLGIHGAFYVVAGYVARSMDGMRPPYGDTLLPPLSPRTARAIAEHLTTVLGHPVAIVDINDRGGSVRAVAGSSMSRQRLTEVLRDNPLGQRGQSTPIAIVRRATTSDRGRSASGARTGPHEPG
jgi:F420-0:gamma-glutamyl ligase